MQKPLSLYRRITLLILLTAVAGGVSCCEVANAVPRWEAYAGKPFGVGRVTLDVSRGEPSLPLADERFTVLEESGRVFYPVVEERVGRRIIRQLLEIETPSNVTIYFLFRGDQPFDLSGFTPDEQAVRIKPQTDGPEHQKLLDAWWKEYTGQWQRLQRNPQFPPVAENFLVASLARRLDKTLPEIAGGIFRKKTIHGSAWDELLASEPYRSEIDRQLVLGEGEQTDLQAVPAPPEWTQIALEDEPLDEISIEPLAQHVPEECFYVRFGTFTNYLWFRDLNAKWQGDLQNMIANRAIDRAAPKRIEQQLSLRETVLAKILGPQVITDVAIIGLDPYVQEGAAIGILFQAKNSQLLAPDLTSKRREALQKFSTATETSVTIADHEVSLIATPDGQVRSYYIAVDDFHLVTTSKRLVARFIAASDGERPLADLPSFRNARRELPLDRPDTVFAFASEKFFQNLCSPQYHVEVGRRLKSSREAHLLQLARHAAAVEAKAAGSRDELIARGILPENFAGRVDSSNLQEEGETSLDSLRGRPGFFVPVADVPVEQVSQSEAEAYHTFIGRVRSEVGRMPPLMAAVERLPLKDGGDTMRVELLATPVQGWKPPSKLEFFQRGAPTERELQPIAGNLLSAEASIDFRLLPKADSKSPNVIAGLRDFRSPLVVRGGRLATGAETTELIRGYLGISAPPAVLALQRLGDERPLLEGKTIWQAQEDQFLLFSFKREIVEQVLPQLKLQPAERPAQIRLRVEDLTGKQLAETVRALGYMQARKASVSGSRMMNSLVNQLHIRPSESRKLAERLVDGRFVCPLGGEYQLLEPQRGLEFWTSSALPPENRFLLTEIPEGFQLPLLEWFRGLRAELLMDDDALRVRLEVDMAEGAVP